MWPFSRKKVEPVEIEQVKSVMTLGEKRYYWLLGANTAQAQETIEALSFDELWDVMDNVYPDGTYNPVEKMLIDRFYELRPGRTDPFPMPAEEVVP